MTEQTTTQQLWAELAAAVRRYIRRRVADEHAAEDLLQETFLRIHQNLHKVKASASLLAWVYRVARSVVVGYYRQQHRALPLDDEPWHQADPMEGARAMAGNWLAELVRQLPPGYREAVQLAELEGHQHSQVAERLGISVAAAKSRIQRGRAMLREALEACCTFHFDTRGRVMDADPLPNRTVLRDCNCDLLGQPLPEEDHG